MPNWCNNSATFSHQDPDMIKRLVDAYNSGRTMNGFFPCPQDLLDTVAGHAGEDQKAAHEAQIERNLKLHGAKDWYDWQVENWGTKWDFGAEEGDSITVYEGSDQVSISFDTAWAPPIAFYQEMEDEMGFHIKATYFEPGMGFVGEYEAGSDKCYEYGDDFDGVPEHLIDEWDLHSYLDDDETIDIDLDGGLSAINEGHKDAR